MKKKIPAKVFLISKTSYHSILKSNSEEMIIQTMVEIMEIKALEEVKEDLEDKV
jgi:hypothetical protein